MDSGSPSKRGEEFADETIGNSRSWVWLLALASGLLLWAYWPTVCEICSAWVSNADYTHGFFVVPISIWLLWARREQAPAVGFAFDWRGLSLVLVAGLIRIAASRFYLPQIDAWSIPLWIGGVVWLVFGWQVFKWATPSIAFLWFATPLPGTIEIALSTPLQRVAASLSTFVLRVIGQPAIVEGTTILLDDHVLDVERACSGLRMFYGIFALAFACIALARPARWKAILVLVAAAPVAIAANVMRIVATGILMKYASNEAAQKFSHDFAGIVMIPFAVVLFLLFLLVLGRIVSRLEDSGGVAWLTKWGLGLFFVLVCTVAWGRYQGARAITTLREASLRRETEKDWRGSIQFLGRYLRAVPDDQSAYVHLAELYRDHATSYPDQVRAIDLLQTAWSRQPEKEELALSAARIALMLQDFELATEIATKLKTQTKDPGTKTAATKLRAQSLVNLLQSGEIGSKYTWQNAREELEELMQGPDYDIDHAQILADIYRNRAEDIPEEERSKRADALIDRVVKERPDEPLALLASHLNRLQHGDKSKESTDEAERELVKALELLEKQPKNTAGVRVLLAAAARAEARGNSERHGEFLERAIKLSPSDYRAYLALADLKRRPNTKEAREQAIGVLEGGVPKVGDQAFLLEQPLAALLTESGRLEEADRRIAPLERKVPYIVGPSRGIVRLELGLIRTQIINAKSGPQTAVAHLKQLLDDSDVRLTEKSSPQAVARGYAFLAALYTSLGAPDLALDAYRRAARIDPTNNTLQLQAAALAQQTGDLEGADRDYNLLAKSGTANVDTWVALTELEIRRQAQRVATERGYKPDWSTAEALQENAKGKKASPIVLRLLDAEKQAVNPVDMRTEEPKEIILQLTRDFPTNVQAWRALAAFCLQQKDPAGALAAIDRLDEITDHGIEAAALRAGVLAGSGKPDEAVSVLSKAADNAPANAQPQLAIALARLLNQVGRHAQSFETLETAHEKAPYNLQIVDTLANMAWLDQDWKKLEKYEDWLKTVEGDDGTLWKAYKAQRLLAKVQTVEDPEFKEVVSISDSVSRERPRWSKAHFLQGEVAYRTNHVDAASSAFVRAWELGARGPLVADRLIDSLTRQGNLEEARKYVAQIREYIGYSPGLFDRAIPYLSNDDDGKEMVRVAQQWVKDKPDSAEAQLRLGRVLLMLAESLKPDGGRDTERRQYIAEAEKAFQSAITLAPSDIRPWAASVMLYGTTADSQDDAVKVLENFAKQESISKLQRYSALAQLYEYLGKPVESQYYFQQATSAAQADPKAPGASETLGRSAQFYLPRVPALAETCARAALTGNPKNSDARLVLIYLLANRSDPTSAKEALQLLDDPASKGSVDPALATRLRALTLSQSEDTKNLESAIELLQQSISQTREDKLLLTTLYERSGQIPRALETLEQLVRSPTAQPSELAAYLNFWQKHFLRADGNEGGTQFVGKVNEIYQRLGSQPSQLPEMIRWQIREAKARDPKHEVPELKVDDIVKEALDAPELSDLPANNAKLLMRQFLAVLLQEEFDSAALKLATSPPKPLTPDEAAILLCHSFIAVPSSPDNDSQRLKATESIQSAFSDKPAVIQAVGDCLFIAGKYEKSIAAYEQALKLDPNLPMARNNLALALAEAPDKIAEARKVLAVAIAAAPENADLLDTQATLDIIDHKPQQAIPILQKIVAAKPDNPVFQLHLAIANYDAENAGPARDSLIAASALGVEQQVLSPRDKQSLQTLQNQYLKPPSSPPSNTQSSTNPQSAT